MGSAGVSVVWALITGSDTAGFPTLVVSGLMWRWCWSVGWGFSRRVVPLVLVALRAMGF